MTAKAVAYVGQKGWVNRLGLVFYQDQPEIVPAFVARKLLMSYPLEFEVLFKYEALVALLEDGRLEDALALLKPAFEAPVEGPTLVERLEAQEADMPAEETMLPVAPKEDSLKANEDGQEEGKPDAGA